MIIKYSIIVFITQLIFIGTRTWNVKAVSNNKVTQVLLSGAIIHIAWLIATSTGVASMHKIITEMDWQYLPVVFCSLSGGLLGSYISMKING